MTIENGLRAVGYSEKESKEISQKIIECSNSLPDYLQDEFISVSYKLARDSKFSEYKTAGLKYFGILQPTMGR